MDGYAGTGAVGIEALSRGAAHVTFVEQDPRAVRLIESNLRTCGVSDRYAIIRAGFSATAKSGSNFDLIFMDPPYGARELNAALETAAPLVRHDTLLILEHAPRDPAPEQYGPLARVREVVQGDSALAFYRAD